MDIQNTYIKSTFCPAFGTGSSNLIAFNPINPTFLSILELPKILLLVVGRGKGLLNIVVVGLLLFFCGNGMKLTGLFSGDMTERVCWLMKPRKLSKGIPKGYVRNCRSYPN